MEKFINKEGVKKYEINWNEVKKNYISILKELYKINLDDERKERRVLRQRKRLNNNFIDNLEIDGVDENILNKINLYYDKNFTKDDREEIIKFLEDKMEDDFVFNLALENKVEDKIEVEENFFNRIKDKVVELNPKIVYFDLDETLLSHKDGEDIIRPSQKEIFNFLKNNGIKIGILTSRDKEFVPERILKDIDKDEIYGGNEIKEKSLNEYYTNDSLVKKYNSTLLNDDPKAHFAILAKEKGEKILIVDDAVYAENCGNCLHIGRDIIFYNLVNKIL